VLQQAATFVTVRLDRCPSWKPHPEWSGQLLAKVVALVGPAGAPREGVPARRPRLFGTAGALAPPLEPALDAYAARRVYR